MLERLEIGALLGSRAELFRRDAAGGSLIRPLFSPVLGSVLAHASVALIAGGHGLGPAAAPPPRFVENAIEVEAVPLAAEPLAPGEAVSSLARTNQLPTHTHTYPVPADHDLRPHDAALIHVSPSQREAASDAVVTAEPSSEPARFVLAAQPAFAMHAASVPGGERAASNAEGSSASEVLPESMVSVPARLLATSALVYPPAARAAEVEADVAVEIVVDPAGRVSDARVLRPTGYGLDEAAQRAVRGYRFSPAQRAGQPVRVRMRWTVQFRLR